MGNLPSSISTEPPAQGRHRNLSTMSLPPTIPRRHNIKDAERKEIFPISDEGAPPFPVRRGSIGFFRGKRARAPIAFDHDELFKNLQGLQTLQNLDMTHCSWQAHQDLSDSNPNSNLNSLSTTPTTAATPALTAAATPTTPIGSQHQNILKHHSHSHPHPHPHTLSRSVSRSPQPTSPVAASIQDYHVRQEQKLATFMKRNLLPPHALLTPTSVSSSCQPSPSTISFSTPPCFDCCPSGASFTDEADHRHPQMIQRPHVELQSCIDSIPSTHDVPCLSVSDWGNQGRWAGEQEWSDDIPEGLEHDGGPWDVMDSYTVEQHITRALFKGQNYSAPLDFSRKTQQQAETSSQTTTTTTTTTTTPTTVRSMTEGDFEIKDTEATSEQGEQPIPQRRRSGCIDCDGDGGRCDFDVAVHHPLASSFSSMATLGPHSAIVPSKENEQSLVILSVGCGNSQWATEMALAHPQSAIHAINVSQVPSLPPIPETTPSFELDNLFFYNLDDNSLKVPFVSNSVDYIHVRRFLPNVNKTKYLAFLRELVRVLKVDGYMELVELDLRLRDSGVDNCWPSYWTLIGFDKLGIDTSLALNLGGILRTMPDMEVVRKSGVIMPVGIHGGRIGLAAELLCWRFALTVRPWLMRQAMLSGSEFDDLLERARQETRTLKSYQVCHVAVARKIAPGAGMTTTATATAATTPTQATTTTTTTMGPVSAVPAAPALAAPALAAPATAPATASGVSAAGMSAERAFS